MGRHRIITLIGLTSLVATMVTFTRYSSNFDQRSTHFSPKLIPIQHHIQHETLDKTKINDSIILNDLNSFNSQLSDKSIVLDNHRVRDQREINSYSLQLKSSSSQPTFVQSLNSDNNNVVKNVINNRESILSNIKTLVTIKSTAGTALKNQMSEQNKSENKIDFKIDIKNIIKDDVKNSVNIDVDQKSKETDNQNIQNIDSYENENNYSKAIIKPKLIFDLEDLRTTESMKIDKQNGCDNDLGASLDLLVIVNSAVDHFEARDAIRKTWGKFAIERGAYLLFLIGNTVNDEIQQKVNAEDIHYEDILQGRYIDNYFNLTLKTISMMKWISERCNRVKYVLKVDDDMFVNMQHITDFSETRTFTKVIIGKLAKKWKPHRSTSNKWYVPQQAFNRPIFPNFATGPAYLFSGDSAKPLYQTSIKLTPMYLEDVYMTGIVAEKAGIRRLNHALMKNINIHVNACNFKKIMTSHKHSPEEIIKLWDLVYSQPSKPCDSNQNKVISKKSQLLSKPAQKIVNPTKTRAAQKR